MSSFLHTWVKLERDTSQVPKVSGAIFDCAALGIFLHKLKTRKRCQYVIKVVQAYCANSVPGVHPGTYCTHIDIYVWYHSTISTIPTVVA